MAKEDDLSFPKYKTPKRVLFTMNAMHSVMRSRAERVSKKPVKAELLKK